MIKQGQGMPLGPKCSRFAVLYSGQTLPPSVALGTQTQWKAAVCSIVWYKCVVYCRASCPRHGDEAHSSRVGVEGGRLFLLPGSPHARARTASLRSTRLEPSMWGGGGWVRP